MINDDNNPTFVKSTLKVVASEDMDIEKELASENKDNKTIDELLDSNDEEKK